MARWLVTVVLMCAAAAPALAGQDDDSISSRSASHERLTQEVNSLVTDEDSRTYGREMDDLEKRLTREMAEEGVLVTPDSVVIEDSSRRGRGVVGELENRLTHDMAQESVLVTPDSVVTDDSSRRGRGVVGDFAVRVALECLLMRDWGCVQTRTLRAVTEWFTGGPSKVQTSEGGDGGQIRSTLFRQLTEALSEGFSALFLAKDESERRSMVLRGSCAIDNAVENVQKLEDTDNGRKKVKKGAAELATKLLMLKAAIFTKISTLVHLKTFIVMKLALLVSAAKLLMQIKSSKSSSGPAPPVIKIVQMTSPPQEEHHESHEHVYPSHQEQGPELTAPHQYGSYRRTHLPYYYGQQDDPRDFQDHYQQIYRRRR